GAPPPVYDWFLNGTEIAMTTTNSLILHNVRATNEGTYSVIASNSEGSVTNPHPIYLAVVAEATNAGSMDLDFYPSPGANAAVNAVLVQTDGKVLIGGAFTNVGGLT